MALKFDAEGWRIDILGVLAFNKRRELAFSILAMKITVSESNGPLCSHGCSMGL